MNPVGKALWFIESHFASEITLEEVANVAGVSRYHLTRAFGDITGHSLIRYVRARRLTEAARALAGGATDILAVALDAGYGSHEAFTRAFREQFDLTPEAIRKQGHLADIELLEPIKMEETVRTSVPPVRFEHGKVLLIAGITIWNKWLPESGHELVDAPDFERYSEVFDPRTGTGGLELWVPIKA
jgi:AraC family transcriptional regulator